jgi:hypothetical protein
MDVAGMWRFASRLSSRPMLAGAAICMLLAVPVIWTVRQSRLTREALDRAAAAEKAAMEVRSDLEQGRLPGRGRPPRDPAVRRSHHDDPEQIGRVRQLYADIDDLARFQERVDARLGGEPRTAPRQPAAAPGPTR